MAKVAEDWSSRFLGFSPFCSEDSLTWTVFLIHRTRTRNTVGIASRCPIRRLNILVSHSRPLSIRTLFHLCPIMIGLPGLLAYLCPDQGEPRIRLLPKRFSLFVHLVLRNSSLLSHFCLPPQSCLPSRSFCSSKPSSPATQPLQQPNLRLRVSMRQRWLMSWQRLSRQAARFNPCPGRS